MKNLKNTPLIVIYHQDCIDGLASAWAVAQASAENAPENGRDPAITYISYGHHDIARAEADIRAALENTPGAAVMFVDVAPTRAFLQELCAPSSLAARVVVMDHHLSAADQLADFPAPDPASGSPALDIHIDPKHPSAANMIWQKLLPHRQPPVFLSLIAKMDLGRYLVSDDDFAAAALVDSKSIRDIDTAFRSFAALAHLNLQDMIILGRNIVSDQDNRIAKLSDTVMYACLSLGENEPAQWVPVVNADVRNFGRYISVYLCQQGERTTAGIGLAWYMQGNGSITVSLRSNGTPDARKIAEHLCRKTGATGGGHETSAAIHFKSLQDFMQHIHPVPKQEMLRLGGRLKPARGSSRKP